MMGTGNGTVISEIPYDNYEESLLDLVNISVGVFSKLNKEVGHLALEKAAEASSGGDTIFIGTPGLCIFWHPCDGDCGHSHVAQYN